MKSLKLLTIIVLMLLCISFLLAQTPPINVGFRDTGTTTKNKVLSEEPNYVNTMQWKYQFYKTTDNIIDPLDPLTNLPTGDDELATNINNQMNLSFAPTGAWTSATIQCQDPGAGPYNVHKGDKIYLRIFNSNNMLTATKYLVFNGVKEVPYTVSVFQLYDATGAIVDTDINGWSDWITIAPVTDTWTYNLAISASDNGAYEFTDPLGGVHTTPATLTDGPGDEENGLLGTYTVTSPAPAGFTWQSTTIEVVAGDFTAAKTDYVYNAAKQFVLVPIPDTYTYNLHINGPEGYAVTGPTAELSGTIPYTKTSTVVTDLVGNYTVAAPPAGYQWVMNPITVTADMFQLATKKTGGMNKVVLGSRTNGAKANYVYEATITFVMEPIPVQYYNVLITSEPAGAAILVDNVDTGFVTPYTFTMEEGASATYTVVMDHYTWNPTEFVVTNISENMSCNFVGTPYYDIPDGVPTTPPGATVTVTITITGGNANYGSGVLPPWVNPSFTPIEQYFLSLIGTGPWTITFNTTAPWAAYFLGGIWHAVQNTGLAITFTIDVSKDVPNVPVVLGNEDPTLPVELSYFAATLTAENFVNIAWTTQTETNMNGFNIYRNDGSDNLASANRIAYIPATNTSTTQNYEHLDNKDLENGHTYYYWLECVEISGHSTFNGPRSAYVDGPTTPELPNCTTMHNAYPNPFRAGSGTTIAVEVKKGDSGTVTIYNILGQVVKTFSLTEGTNNLNWNGRDSKGNLCGNGIYFYKLSTNSLNQTKKMVIVK
jgi:hypothetical protein